MNTEYNYVYIRGDYDARSLPEFDVLMPGFQSAEETDREINMVVEEYNSSTNRKSEYDRVSREDYVIVKRQVADWEVVK